MAKKNLKVIKIFSVEKEYQADAYRMLTSKCAVKDFQISRDEVVIIGHHYYNRKEIFARQNLFWAQYNYWKNRDMKIYIVTCDPAGAGLKIPELAPDIVGRDDYDCTIYHSFWGDSLKVFQSDPRIWVKAEA